MDEAYAGICGISESELITYFQPEIASLAAKLGKSSDKTLAELKKRYDGYHFCENTEGMYNPFSLLNTFAKLILKNYWFETGTPTFLAKMFKDAGFDTQRLDNGLKVSVDFIANYRAEYADPLPLLYQSGYFTIKSYNARFNSYTLGFPNEEVKYGFLNELLPLYIPKEKQLSEFSMEYFIDDLSANNVDGFMKRMRAFFASISYELNNKVEKDFQTAFFLLFTLMGPFIEVEHRSAIGRSDAVVKTDDTIYVFEFKLTESATAEEALQQIDDKGYLIPFTAGNRKLVKIGVEFSIEKRGISGWKEEKYNG
jgi:hypothetical protein